MKLLMKLVPVFLLFFILPACSSSTPIGGHPAVQVIYDYWEAMNDLDAEKALSYLEPAYREAEREDVEDEVAQMAPLKFLKLKLTITETSEPVYIEEGKLEIRITLSTPIGDKYLLYHLVQVDGEWKIIKQTTDRSKTPPGRAPTQLIATAISSTQIDLSWSDNSSIEDGYRIERATDTGFTTGLTTFTVEASVAAYSDVSVVSATTYYYRVLAFNTAGDSLATNTVTATTP